MRRWLPGEGEGEAEFGVRGKEVYIGPTVPLRQSQEPTPVAYYCTDVCSINECERNGRMYGTVILQYCPTKRNTQLSYLVTVIINNRVNHTVFHFASNRCSRANILTKSKKIILTGFNLV